MDRERHMRGGNASITVWLDMTSYDWLWLIHAIKSRLLCLCVFSVHETQMNKQNDSRMERQIKLSNNHVYHRLCFQAT